MDTHLDNLASSASQEKGVLEKLVNNNKKLITKLDTLTNKCNQLSGDEKGSSDDGTLMLKEKNLKFLQCYKSGYCFTHGCKCTKENNNKIWSNPWPYHKKDATRQDIKNGSTKNKNYSCSYYEEKYFGLLLSVAGSLGGIILSALK